MIKRQVDFHIYLQYRDMKTTDFKINKVDIVSSVKRYTLKGGPENPIRYLEMELDRLTVKARYADIIDNIVEGETRLIIDAVDTGTFIISKIWLEDNIYEIVALGSESVISGTTISVGMDNIKPSHIASAISEIWRYSADWNGDYSPETVFSTDFFDTKPLSIYTDTPSALILQLCALADDAVVFFGNTFHPSRIDCKYNSGTPEVDDAYYLDFDYTSYLTGERITMQLHYVVESKDDTAMTCVLRCTDNNDYGDLSEEIKEYLQSEYGESICLYKQTDTDKKPEDRVSVIYDKTVEYAHYQDCLYYVRYSDIGPINPDTMYPDRDGEINLYSSLDDYNRRYSDFDTKLFKVVSEISSQNSDASSTLVNRQWMAYMKQTIGTDEHGQEIIIKEEASSVVNTNGRYSTDSEGKLLNPYYTGGVKSIETYGFHEGVDIYNLYFRYAPRDGDVNPIIKMCNNMVRRYKDPSQSMTFTVNESKTDEFGYNGWERFFNDFSYANKINDHIHDIYLTNEHRCDGVEDKSLLRLSSYTRHYPEMTTTYTFGSVRESGLSQMIADINQRTQ